MPKDNPIKATMDSGDLIPLKDCYIFIPHFEEHIFMKILPDISDGKSASYATENAIGRSQPFNNYSYSETRTIAWTAHFMVCKNEDKAIILKYLRLLESATYPINSPYGGAPYAPPPTCLLRCGDLLAADKIEVCAVLKSYSVKFDTSVPWDQVSYIPYKLDVDLQFEVVNNQEELPGAEQIMEIGY